MASWAFRFGRTHRTHTTDALRRDVAFWPIASTEKRRLLGERQTLLTDHATRLTHSGHVRLHAIVVELCRLQGRTCNGSEGDRHGSHCVHNCNGSARTRDVSRHSPGHWNSPAASRQIRASHVG